MNEADKLRRRFGRQVAKIRNRGESRDCSWLAERERIARRVYAHAEAGEVGLSVWQMDCDCASWTSYYILPAVPVIIERKLDDLYQYAEGPVSASICFPSLLRDQEPPPPRDHALEAYENGHPYSIHL